MNKTLVEGILASAHFDLLPTDVATTKQAALSRSRNWRKALAEIKIRNSELDGGETTGMISISTDDEVTSEQEMYFYLSHGGPL